jgi:hypothetical protein
MTCGFCNQMADMVVGDCPTRDLALSYKALASRVCKRLSYACRCPS